jgi:hypothetical protein
MKSKDSVPPSLVKSLLRSANVARPAQQGTLVHFETHVGTRNVQYFCGQDGKWTHNPARLKKLLEGEVHTLITNAEV